MPEDTREKEIAHRESAKEKSVQEYYARSEAAKPTPTPEEADRAKLGLPVNEPEHDGSEPEEVVQRRVLEGRIPGNNPYDTRAVTQPPDGEAAPARPWPPSGT
jgi:hypothetical protein